MERRVTGKNLIMYGVGDLYGGGSFFIIGTLFLFFLTEVVGLTPIRAGLVISLGKGWDAISDPLMGYISDGIKNPHGRRRIFFLLGIVPIFMSFTLLWSPVGLEGDLLFLWYLFAYIFFSTVFTMVMVPYAAINAEMSHDYKVRTRLSGARIIFSQLSALISGVLPKLIIDSFQGGRGYLIMGILFGLFYALPWIAVFKGTWELPFEEVRPSSFFRFYKDFLTVFKNRSFRLHLSMYILAYSAMDIMMAMFIYYLTYYIDRQDLFPLLMGSMVLTQILFLPIYVKISNILGKGHAYIMGLSIWGLGLLLLFTFSVETQVMTLVLGSILIGAGLSAGVMIPWAILPSITDVDELITTKKRAGVYSGMMTLLRKMIQALVLFLVGILLNQIGYIPDVVQEPSTLQSLRLFFVFGPLVMILLGIMTAFRFKITPKTHHLLMEEIARRRGGGKKEDVSLDVRHLCEELTGIRYENLYKPLKN